jgi:hypothetical protein
MIPIEKNVPYRTDPLTTRYHGAKGDYVASRKWPWLQMHPGDSFTVTTYPVMHSARCSFLAHRKTVHCKFPPSWFIVTKRVSGDPANGVYRLWLFDRENPETPVDKTP